MEQNSLTQVVSFFTKFTGRAGACDQPASRAAAVAKRIKDLYRAIQTKDEDLICQSFFFLTSHFKITHMGGEAAGLDKDDINYQQIIEIFLRMLRKYKEQSTAERSMSLNEIDELIKKLKTQLQNMDSIECLSCRTRIYANDSECRNCGWTWNGPLNANEM